MQEGINNLFAGAVFLAGVLSFFSPCVFPLLPVYLGKLAEDPGTRSFSFFGLKVYVSPLVKTVCFITGLSTVFSVSDLEPVFQPHFLSSLYAVCHGWYRHTSWAASDGAD